jgi:hypothetical protein
LGDAAANANLDTLCMVVRTESELFFRAYKVCHDIVKTDAGYDALLAAARDAAERHPVACKQGSPELFVVYLRARAVLPVFQAAVRKVVAGFKKLKTSHNTPRVQLVLSPLKHLNRCREKMCFKKEAAQRFRASAICDVVRCIIECDDSVLMTEVLQAILTCPFLAVQRVKDRANTPTRQGWMDVMVNVIVVSDEHKHVCEIQIVHSKMLLARSGLGGHGAYARVRSATEMLAVRGVLADPAEQARAQAKWRSIRDVLRVTQRAETIEASSVTPFEMLTASSAATDTVLATSHVGEQLLVAVGTRAPKLIILHYTSTHDPARVLQAAQGWATAACGDRQQPALICGASSCRGVLTADAGDNDTGFVSSDSAGGASSAALAACAFVDDGDRRYGVGFEALTEGAPAAAVRAAGHAAAADAMSQLDKPPKALWLLLTPGHEENALDGINAAVLEFAAYSPQVFVMGGMSAADNTVEGGWSQIAGGVVLSRAVVVVALCPSADVEAVYNSGYAPSACTGTLHGTAGRKVACIRPNKVGRRRSECGASSSSELAPSPAQTAASVYNRWTSGAIDDYVGGGNILAASSLFPLGRMVGHSNGGDASESDDEEGESALYQIIHPDSVTSNGELTFFGEVHEGEQLTLMAGDTDMLVKLPLLGIRKHLMAPAMKGKVVVGSLLTYCGGCMLQLEPDDQARLARRFTKTLPHCPIFGSFSFGEQGMFQGRSIEDRRRLGCHGNLMVSALLFLKNV